jgi:tRNA threonylcarbamoyladenosine biosynthesis protein TsaE
MSGGETIGDPAALHAHAAAATARCPAGTCVLLRGDLGAGKTEWVRGFVAALGGGGVHSPTFTLVNLYETPKGQVRHWDLYRLGKGTDWSVLDLAEDAARAKGWTLVEWPERYPGPWPDSVWRLYLEGDGDSPRRAVWENK